MSLHRDPTSGIHGALQTNKKKEYIAIGLGNIYLISISQKQEKYEFIDLYILGLSWYNGHHKSM